MQYFQVIGLVKRQSFNEVQSMCERHAAKFRTMGLSVTVAETPSGMDSDPDCCDQCEMDYDHHDSPSDIYYAYDECD